MQSSEQVNNIAQNYSPEEETEMAFTRLVRQSHIVQNAMYSHMYDALSYITPAVPLTLSQLGILTMRHNLAVSMFDVCIFIHSPRVTYYSKVVFYVDF